MNIYCVIVCYHPSLVILKSLCQAVKADGGRVILVDNSESPSLTEEELLDSAILISLNKNTGIAHAQNIGISRAIFEGADIVVFFDQDSTIPNGFLKRLLSPISVGNPDIVAPLYLDDSSNTFLPSLRVSCFGISTEIHHNDAQFPYCVDIVISSGTAATKEVFVIAGLLDEDFFIDFVDTEWCLRCRSKGIPVRVVPQAVMRHRIGSSAVKVGPLTIMVHSPSRCYYQIRNGFNLFRKSHVPRFFAAMQLISVILNRILLLFYVDNRMAYLKAYACGFRDGLLGVVGSKSIH
jgi:rhamnosyltransferase